MTYSYYVLQLACKLQIRLNNLTETPGRQDNCVTTWRWKLTGYFLAICISWSSITSVCMYLPTEWCDLCKYLLCSVFMCNAFFIRSNALLLGAHDANMHNKWNNWDRPLFTDSLLVADLYLLNYLWKTFEYFGHFGIFIRMWNGQVSWIFYWSKWSHPVRSM